MFFSVSFSQILVFPGRQCSKACQHILDIVGLSQAELWRTYLFKGQFLPIKVCLIKVSNWVEPVLNTLTLWSKYCDSKKLWDSSLINHYIALNIPHFDQRGKPAWFIRSTFCESNYHHLKAISRLINSARYNRFQLLSLINKNVDRINRPLQSLLLFHENKPNDNKSISKHLRFCWQQLFGPLRNTTISLQSIRPNKTEIKMFDKCLHPGSNLQLEPTYDHCSNHYLWNFVKVAGEDRSATNGKWLNPVVQKWRYLSCYYV